MEDRTFDRISRALAGTTSRRQAFRLIGGGIAGGALATVGLKAATANPTANGSLNVEPLLLPDGRTVTLVPTQFVNDGGTLTGIGNVLDAANTFAGTFSALITNAVGDCEILELVLGPIHLDLLGLVVDVPGPIVLTITAVPGQGNLLGNLLCAVANLLNGGGPLGAIAGLLNNILRNLGLA